MSKEQEAFNRIMETYGKTNSLEGTYDDFLTIKKALQELEDIKNVKPNEALELVSCLKDYLLNMIPYYDWLNDIDKYILKAQGQEKVLNIITKKNIDIFELKISKKVEEYNVVVKRPFDTLTQEEFKLLKEYFKYE